MIFLRGCAVCVHSHSMGCVVLRCVALHERTMTASIQFKYKCDFRIETACIVLY